MSDTPRAREAQPDDDSGRRITDQVARFLLMRVDRLSRIVPSDLEADDQMCRNGEYVSLYEVQQLLTGLFAPPAPEAAPTPHYFTPDPTKRFCVVCGDNDIGSVWGIHRFQIQPGDPDFKAAPEAAREGWRCRCGHLRVDHHVNGECVRSCPCMVFTPTEDAK